MTVIQEPIEDIAGASYDSAIRFRVPVLRESSDGTSTVVTERHWFMPVDGVLTTDDLDPGPAKVQIGSMTYDIIIPVSSTPVRLWPLIDAGMPQPAPSTPGFVKDGGGVTRVQAVNQATYESMVHDPATLYIIKDSFV